jgi:hypothetical protein
MEAKQMLKPDSPKIYLSVAKPDSTTGAQAVIRRNGDIIFQFPQSRGQLLKLLREVSAALA